MQCKYDLCITFQIENLGCYTCAHRLCKSLPPIYPYGYLHALVILMIIPRRSCCYNMPRNILRCPENPWSLLSCSFISHETPHGYFLTNYRGPVLLDCSYVSQSSSEYFSMFRKSSAGCYSCNSCLLALWLIPYD